MAIAPQSVRSTMFRVFFFGALIFLLWQLLRIFAPFLSDLVAAATLVIVFHPAHLRLERLLRGRSSLAAALSTVLVLLLVIIPVLLLMWLVFRELTSVLPQLRDWIATVRSLGPGGWREVLPVPLQDLLVQAEAFLAQWGLDVPALALSSLDHVGEKVSRTGVHILRNTFKLAFDVAIIALAVFFFFRDGSRMVRAIVENVPMERGHVERIVARLENALAAVVRGVFVTAVVQGALAGIGFAIVGLPFAVLAGFLTTFLALIPFVGAAAIWVPACLYLFATGHVAKGVIMLCWGMVISLGDNFLKPLLIGGRAQVSTFLLFFGILGGLQVYGFLGILIGPVLIALALTFLQIYREQFRPGPATPDLPPAGTDALAPEQA